MGMDGFFRPSESLGYMDSLGYLNAADRAEQAAKKANQVDQGSKVDAIDKDPKENNRDGQQPYQQGKPGQFEEELQEILATQFNVQFDPDGMYFFDYDEEHDLIKLIDLRNEKVILTMPPSELMRVTEHLRSNNGVITDRFG